jgi:hypothetical protein
MSRFVINSTVSDRDDCGGRDGVRGETRSSRGLCSLKCPQTGSETA